MNARSFLAPRVASAVLSAALLWQAGRIAAALAGHTGSGADATPAVPTAPAVTASPRAPDVAAEIVASSLFGQAPDFGSETQTATLVLTGTLAFARDHGGFAIIGAGDGAPKLRRVGTPIMDGITLLAVYADHVDVDRAGRRDSVYLSARRALVASASGAAIPIISAREVDEESAGETVITEDQGLRDNPQLAMATD
jgi:hypothetical protein